MARDLPGVDLPGVDLHRLGRGALLHAPASGALVLAGDEALAAGQAAHAARAAQREMAQDGAAILAEWERAGLFRSAPLPFPNAASWRPADAAPLRLALGRRRVELRCDHAALAADLATVLAPLRHDAGGTPRARVDILAQDDAVAVFRDRSACFGWSDMYVARHLALREVLLALHGSPRVGAVLHAASVARTGRSLVLAGHSGAGKSTLAMQLLADGWTPVADDLTALDRQGHLLPFPTRLSLKRGSWRLAPERFRIACEAGAGGDRDIRYLDVPRPGHAPVAPGVLVFPGYEREATVTMRPISPEEALVRLIDSGTRLAGQPATAAALVRFLRAVPAVALTHGGGRAARAACAALLDDAEPAT